ncbi:hypothetical protein FPHOBKDP_00030 [Listeria phage LPJP1]|nr:hypothetical protein FPHOBKDP_00030 [Listeria phage LPJP1]
MLLFNIVGVLLLVLIGFLIIDKIMDSINDYILGAEFRKRMDPKFLKEKVYPDIRNYLILSGYENVMEESYVNPENVFKDLLYHCERSLNRTHNTYTFFYNNDKFELVYDEDFKEVVYISNQKIK